MREFNAIVTIAYRDFVKFLRDKPRFFITFIFPLIFIIVLGGSLNANLGEAAGYNFMTFVFIGVLGQTIFQSSAAGVISLIEDKENDFSQEIFVSPISRYSIITGKIFGESLVAMVQAVGIILLGFILRVPFSFGRALILLPVGLVVAFMGAAFGILIMANLPNQKSANQIFPFLILPQFFLAGTFNPIKNLPIYLWILSRIAPMTYAVDFMRSVYYQGMPEYSKVVLFSPITNMVVICGMLIVFITLGTFFFVKNERNK